ncbi:MAG: chromosomal replication initiator protein DnaA [Kofleriaceae bacterium]
MTAVRSESTLWEAAIERLAGRVSQQTFEMWLSPIECLDIDAAAHRLRLRAPNSYVRQWFELHFLPAVLTELAELGGHPMTVDFADEAAPTAPTSLAEGSQPIVRAAALDLGDDDLAPTEPAPAAVAGPAPTVSAIVSDDTTQPEHDLAEPPARAHLNPRYTFETFVAGPSNQLAFAASQAAATSYPPKWNPLFLWGGAGLGKTHLLHAIGREHVAARPSTRVVYISCERFINEYISAVQTRQMHLFRRRYRDGIDVLLVDDIQFLAGKDSTQDEFFHTFNALYDGQKQIVLTADRKPSEISDIADRLRTRFQWGLLADIEPPELEVRIAILRKKAGAEGIVLPDDVALYIASSIKSNVRELEGALIRLSASASLLGRRIDLAFAQESLGGSMSRSREVVTVDGVLRAVASYYGVKTADLKSPRRHKSIAAPRAVAMYLARQHTKDSYPDLGRAFGGKHHTTIISAVDKVAGKLKDDPALRGEIHAIESALIRS